MNKLFRTLIQNLFFTGFLSFLCCTLNIASSEAQEIGVGEWRFHLSYRSARAVEKAGDRIYCGTRNGLFYVTPSDQQIHRLSPMDGFSGISVTAMAYDQKSRNLFIAYENGMLDVINNNEIRAYSAIASTQIIGDKRVNAIDIHEGTAYLSCSFGVIEFDIRNKGFGSTYFGPQDPGLATYGVAFTDSSIYASSANGLLKAPFNQGYNLKDPNAWQTVDSNSSGPLGIQNEWLYTRKDSALVKYNLETSAWQVLNDSLGNRVYNIDKTGETLFIAAFQDTYKVSKNGNETLVGIAEIQDLFIDEKEALWYAHDRLSLNHYTANENLNYYIPNGPQYKNAWSGKYANGKIHIAAGGLTTNFGAAYNFMGYYTFENGSWDSYNNNTSSDFQKINMQDILNVAISPITGNTFIASFLRGLVETDEGTIVQHYTDTNSKLQTVDFSNDIIRVADAKFDKENNLWITNNLTDKPLVVKTPEDEWHSYNLGALNEVLNIEIDDAGQKWIRVVDNGVIVFNDNGTLANTRDDRFLHLDNRSNQGNLPSTRVNAITKDHEGNIWLGTNDGVAVFYDPASIFDRNNVNAQQIYIEDNGDGGYLLSGESVNAITVDGANDKWVGTSNGVWHIAADGSEILKRFTEDNSPLLSNQINDIIIHEETGEVFFATEEGTISYRGEATEGQEKHNDVYAFPNPVKPDHSGPITIKGLVSNANVKITDVNDHLVTEIQAKGGQVVWDGTNLNGNKVSSGVYFVYSSSEFGEETFVTKIMIISE